MTIIERRKRYDHQQICDLYVKDKKTVKQIMDITGCSKSWISVILGRNNIDLKGKGWAKGTKGRTGHNRGKAPKNKSGKAMRTCLRCDKSFNSKSIKNRVCNNCRESNNNFADYDMKSHVNVNR